MSVIPELEQDVMTPTDEEVSLIDDPVIEPKETDNEEDELAVFVHARLAAMQKLRSNRDQHWNTYQKQYEAPVVLNEDRSASINRPIEFVVIENKEAELGTNDPVIKFEPTTEADVEKIKPNQIVWDYIWGKDKTSQKLKLFHRPQVFKFGYSAWFEGLIIDNRIISDPSSADEDGVITYQKKLKKTIEIGGRATDIRNFFWDDRTAVFCDETEDCIEIEELSLDAYRLKYGNNKLYKGVNSVVPRNKIKSEEFVTEEEEGVEETDDILQVIHYWNKLKDQYLVVTDFVVNRHTPIPFAHKELPYSVQLDHVDGRGECEILQSTKSEMNTFREIIQDQSKMSSSPAILAGKNFNFDGIEPMFDNGIIWNFTGDLGEMQQFKVSPPDAAAFSYLDILEEDIVFDTGIDPRSLFSSEAKTAFQAGLQEQSKNKRLNVSGQLQDYFYERAFNQRLSNIQQFFPVKLVRTLMDMDKKGNAVVKEGDKTFPSIGVEDKAITREKGNLKVKEAKGEFSTFEVRPEDIRSHLHIRVVTNSTRPLLKELAKDNAIKMIESIVQMAQLDPSILQDIDLRKVLKSQLGSFDVSFDDIKKSAEFGNQDVEEGFNKMIESLPGSFQTDPQLAAASSRTEVASQAGNQVVEAAGTESVPNQPQV